jgi:hypothetical protein
MKTKADIEKISQENASAKGTFTASRNGKQFLVSDFLFFAKWGKDYAVIGSENNTNWITFSLPTDQEGLGPHTEHLYDTGENLVWEVLFDGERHSLKEGVVTYTFNDEQRSGIKGSLVFDLKDGSRVVGKFELEDIARLDEKTQHDIKKWPRGTGSFTARVGGEKNFLDARFVSLHDADKHYFIIGHDVNVNSVAFSVPSNLACDIPHEVPWYTEEFSLRWQVQIEGKAYDVVSGTATITFKDERKWARGKIDFLLGDRRRVTGEFDILSAEQ